MTMEAPAQREGDDDVVIPFQIEGSAVRGRIARLGASMDDILRPHGFSPALSTLTGEATVLAAMFGASLKFDGKLIFQAQGDGPVAFVIANYRAGGALRATAKAEDGVAGAPDRAARLLGKGQIVMTIDQGPDMERYQGVTPLEGDTLAQAAVGYFAQSEQIPTAVRAAVGRVSHPGAPERWRAGGVMAQFVPGEGGGRERGEAALMNEEDREAWARAEALLQTAGDHELLDPDISSERLLYRLFHEDGVRVFEPQKVRALCGCNGDAIRSVLARYPEEELEDMAEDGRIVVTCEFCRTLYAFSPAGEPLTPSAALSR